MKARLLALALLTAACGPRGGARSEEPEPHARTSVKVENQGFQDFDVYVLSDAGRVRLGMVRGFSTEEFTVPDDIVRISPQVRFELHPIGGRANPRTETITVLPGDQVELVIPPS